MDDQLSKKPIGGNLSGGANFSPPPQDQDGSLPVTPAVSSGTKETEKIAVVQPKVDQEAVRERGKEVEPGGERVEIQEIALDKEVELDEDLKQMGVEALVPPEVPEEFRPQAEVISLATTEDEAAAGSSQPPTSSFRWLYTLFDRLVKKVGGGFRYVFRNLGTQGAKE